MRHWPKPRTDEDYVEFVRERMKRRKALVAAHICAVLLFVLLVPLSIEVSAWLRSHIPIDLDHIGQWGAVIDGKMVGSGLTLGVCSAILGIRVFRGFRAEHLMIRFYTELGTRACDGNPADPGNRQTEPGKRTLTDEQYVACIRKVMKSMRWIGLLFFCIAVVCLSASLVALRNHWTTVNIYAYKGTWRGLAIGLTGGVLEALAVAGFVVSVTSAGQYIFGHRKERLLLQFHDERRPTEE
jgi:hypothetical protein